MPSWLACYPASLLSSRPLSPLAYRFFSASTATATTNSSLKNSGSNSTRDHCCGHCWGPSCGCGCGRSSSHYFRRRSTVFFAATRLTARYALPKHVETETLGSYTKKIHSLAPHSTLRSLRRYTRKVCCLWTKEQERTAKAPSGEIR